jgi:hypothetical protein
VGDIDLDLSGLDGFSFEPAWGSKLRKQEGARVRHGEEDFKSKHTREDRKAGGRFDGERHGRGTASRNGQESFNRGERRFNGNHDRKGPRTKGNRQPGGERREFIPILDASFYPEDSYFNTAIAAFRLTCKTYELFNVARLFLEKPDHFAVVVKKTAIQDDKNLHMSIDDGYVFADEQGAIKHVLAKHIEKYFDVTEESAEAPKGTFICVHKCGLTGKLLCPPNYHRYQEILIEHHGENFPGMSFQRFKESIESIPDQSVIDEWKASASKVKVYIPKIDGTEKRFSRFSDVKEFFIKNFREQAIKTSDSFRITGSTFNTMPRGILSKSIFILLLREKKFPIGLSNNLRGKLRREKFTIYKIGSSSKIAYVCAVKRKFRSSEDRFEDSIQSVIDCIDTNPNSKPGGIYQKLHPGATIPDDAFSEKDEILSAFIKDLNWLIREGYVAEFEDGRLMATAIVTKEQLAAMNKSETEIFLDKEPRAALPTTPEQASIPEIPTTPEISTEA